MSISNGTQIGGESEYETNAQQLAEIQRQAQEVKTQQEFEGDPSRLGDIRKEAEDAQTVRAAQRSYQMQREAEGNIREFAEQQQRQQQIQEEYGIERDYKNINPTPTMAPGPGGWMQTPEAIPPTIEKGLTAYAETVIGATYISQKGIENLAKKSGRLGKPLEGVSWLVGFGGSLLAAPGTIPLAAVNLYRADKRRSKLATMRSGYTDDPRYLPEKGIEEFTGTPTYISGRQARGQARGELIGDIFEGGIKTGKAEWTEFKEDPAEVKLSKVGKGAFVLGTYVVGVGIGAGAYRVMRKGVVKAAGVKTGKEAAEKVGRRFDWLTQPHELAFEKGIGGFLLGKSGRAGGPAKYPRLSAAYQGPLKGSLIPSEIIGEYWVVGGTKVWSKISGKQMGKGVATGKGGSTFSRYFGTEAAETAAETAAQRSAREGAVYETLTTDERMIFLGQTPAQRAEWKTPGEFESIITGKTYSGTPAESIEAGLTKTKTDTKTDLATEVDMFAQGRTTGTRAGTGSGAPAGSGGGSTTTYRIWGGPATTTQTDTKTDITGETTTETKTDPTGETKTDPTKTDIPGESTTETKNGKSGRGFGILPPLKKKKKPTSARAKGPLDFDFGGDWTKTFKFDMAELSIGDIDPVNGAKQQGGSILGGSMFGDSILGGSTSGGDILGGSAFGGDILGGSTSGGDILGGSAFGDSFFGGGGSGSANMNISDSILGRPSKGGKLL